MVSKRLFIGDTGEVFACSLSTLTGDRVHNGLERNFQQNLLWEDVVVLPALIFAIFSLGLCCGLETTFQFGRIGWP